MQAPQLPGRGLGQRSDLWTSAIEIVAVDFTSKLSQPVEAAPRTSACLSTKSRIDPFCASQQLKMQLSGRGSTSSSPAPPAGPSTSLYFLFFQHIQSLAYCFGNGNRNRSITCLPWESIPVPIGFLVQLLNALRRSNKKIFLGKTSF